MVFDFRIPKKLKITRKKVLEDIVKRNKITGFAATPSTAELFQIDPESPSLDKEEAEKLHSEVASISYVVKKIKTRILDSYLIPADPSVLQHRAGLVQAAATSKLSCGHSRYPANSRNGQRTNRDRCQH